MAGKICRGCRPSRGRRRTRVLRSPQSLSVRRKWQGPVNYAPRPSRVRAAEATPLPPREDGNLFAPLTPRIRFPAHFGATDDAIAEAGQEFADIDTLFVFTPVVTHDQPPTRHHSAVVK